MLKLPNSIDPATMAENIVKLRDAIASLISKTLPDTSEATTGQILGLTGEDKEPEWVDANTLPDTSEATTGQILGLTGDDKEPAWVDLSGGLNYSTTEQNTGLKWIDGRDVFVRSFSGVAGTTKTAIDQNVSYTPIRCDGYIKKSSGLGVSVGCIDSGSWNFAIHVDPNNDLCVMTGGETNGATYYVTVYYVKDTAEEVAKTTKKKTTK